ncbi:non-homologous end-joining DNA ligase [Actinophytocola xanthii]|uniref:DNA ligase (ATP) n=1 Tax=Actinophytocola xanthii TaxID=1912961 RepID=A0A1Q8CGF7_9PSEU|nr:non-homologous end-joining DNA ligase [Actinophytocola xanthii]OLF13400.1 ATP-dependent DNA ligase [Actinophytocola xanthii]
MNGWPNPMLATITDRRFSDDNWIFERKLDGIRTLSIRDGWRPQLWTRNQKRIDESFPDLVEALAELGGPRFVADGEIVAFDGKDRPVSLQTRNRSAVRVYYYLFDLLSLDGTDLCGEPLRDRKRALRDAFRFRDPLRFSEHRDRDGEAFYRHACAQGWEGLIAKRADSPYRGGHSSDWLKFKCVRDQEFVVGGFTEPQGSRAGFGALLIGYHEQGLLRYAGKVGTGYDRATLHALRARMDSMAQSESPFVDEVREPTVHWVRPELVVQVGFSEWTREGRLRHPRFGGLRVDKPAGEVVRESR